MTSARRVSANRRNAHDSTGPRTRRGKSRASRNAYRHGLEAINFGVAGLPKKVTRLAQSICVDASDPFLYEQALIVAESQILVARVRAARVMAIETVRDTSAASASAVRKQSVEASDDIQCLPRALPELLRLERYERRALSRRNGAMRRLDALRIRRR